MNTQEHRRSEFWALVALAAPAIIAGLILGVTALRAQEPTRLYRLQQRGMEVGRESWARAGGVIDRSIVVPLLRLKLDSRTVRVDGRLVRFSATVMNAAGDTVRARYALVATGDSLEVRLIPGADSTAPPRISHPRGPVDGVIPAQSAAVMLEAALQSAGADTTLRYLPMGGDTTMPVAVRHAGDTAWVTLAGIRGFVLRDGAIHVPVQGLVARIWNGVDTLPPLAGMNRPAKDYAAPPGASYVAENVRIPIAPSEGDSFALAGTLTMPRTGRGPWPVVVTISGSGQQDRDEDLWPLVENYRPFAQLAERLAREGIAVLRYDDRMVGGSGGSLGTTGDYAADVRQVVAWLRARGDIDGRRVALLGHSEGGMIGPMVAADDPRLAGLVIMAGPSQTLRAVVRYQFTRPIEVAEGLDDTTRARMLAGADDAVAQWVQSNAWTRWGADWDPLVTARRVRTPVLILHGALDRQVSVGQADSLATAMRAGGNRDVTVRVYPRLNHLFLPTDGDGSPAEYPTLPQTALPDQVLDDAAAWLAAHLGR